jgi:isopenicillin N synthase-like dioxygenase
VLERLTSGRYVSPVHRLSSNRGSERLSMSFYFEPDADAELEPIAEFVRAPVRAEPLQWRGGRESGASLSSLGASR